LTEIVARLPRSRAALRALQLLALAAGLTLLAVGIVALRPQPAGAPALFRPVPASAPVRLPARGDETAVRVRASAAIQARRSAALGRAAAGGHDRGLFTSSPDGIVATAARVVLNFGEGTPVDPNEGRRAPNGMRAWLDSPVREAAQVYVNGKFIGGCDIVRELHQRGELQRIVEEAFED